MEFFHVIGGLIITAKKGKVHDCFRGNPCYAPDTIDEPFYAIDIGGKNFSVPYNEQFGGYSVSVPSSTPKAEVPKLFAAYKDLFGPDTREVTVQAVMFNPSGLKSLTSLEFGAKISVWGNIDFFSNLKSVPYHFYDPDTMHWQLFGEVCLVCFVVWAFVRPLCIYAFCEPGTGDVQALKDDLQLRAKWEAWTETWRYIPAYGGRPLVKWPCILWGAFFASILLWVSLGVAYLEMSKLGDEALDGIFVDPLVNTDHDMVSKVTAALAAMDVRSARMIGVVEQISIASTRYFSSHVVILIACVVRLNQYMSFQKRLAVVTNTFSGISDDLVHMTGLVLLICFCFGVINSLAFGSYDPAFRYFMPSFWEMMLQCFGMYRPASATPFIQSLFKYAPHMGSGDDSTTWVPFVLQMAFKTVVILLLFKLLMGVIMEGYKKHNKGMDKAPTVREDLYDLYVESFHYYICHCIFKLAYVPPFHVALAVARIENSLERPWERDYVGLDHKQAVTDALNNVLSPDQPRRVRAQVARHNLKKCGPAETDYVLSVYGMSHDKAEAIFSEEYVSEEYQQEMKKEKEKLEAEAAGGARKSQIKRDKSAAAQEERDKLLAPLKKQILTSRAQAYKKLGQHDASCDRLSQKKMFVSEDLRETFNDFDIYGLGSINHRTMPKVFWTLGFHLPPQKLAFILAEYDAASDSQDGEADFKEFKGILHDDRLIGHWIGEFSIIGDQLVQSASLGTPLLSA